MTRQIATVGWIAFWLTIAMLVLIGRGHTRDLDGRFANSPLKPWFDNLASKKGRCCSDADGSALNDSDWESRNGHYRVQIGGEWADVPEDAVITEPNRAGRTMVWPYCLQGKLQIRCFIPGPMT